LRPLPLIEPETASDPTEETAAALVARIAAGEARAEERLFARYGRALALLLDRHTQGRPEAEDLLQDTFKLAIAKLRGGELREPEKLPGFLAAIARSLAIEHYRKAARRRTAPDEEAVHAAAAPGASPEEELLTRENAALVRRVIGELGTARDRELLLRFYIAEEDKDAIAAEYGLSSLQFNRVLHRARQRYKELLAARLREGRPSRGMALLILLAVFAGIAGRAMLVGRVERPAMPALLAPLTLRMAAGPRY